MLIIVSPFAFTWRLKVSFVLTLPDPKSLLAFILPSQPSTVLWAFLRSNSCSRKLKWHFHQSSFKYVHSSETLKVFPSFHRYTISQKALEAGYQPSVNHTSGKCVFSFDVYKPEASTLFNMSLFVYLDLSFLTLLSYGFCGSSWGNTVLFDIVPVCFFLIPQM